MPMIKLGPFGGVSPRTGKRYLPDSGAVAAANVKMQSGELRPLREPGFVILPTKTMPPLAIFRARYGSLSAWMTWPYDVDVVRGPFPSEAESRFYWTGDGEPRYGKYTDVVAGGGNDYPHTFYALGVPNPVTAPTVTPSGGTSTNVTRVYCYTFYSQYGEESGPSAISAATTGRIDATWAITAMDAFPVSSGTGTAAFGAGVTTFTNAAAAAHWLRVGDQVVISSTTLTVLTIPTAASFTVAGDYSAAVAWARKAAWNTSGMKRRLYRSAGVDATFQLVSDNVSTTYNDTLTDSQILGDELISVGWEPPPTGLTGLCSHPSGALCGFVGNVFYASEPVQPHAWLASYQHVADFDGVGMEVFGSTVVMATKGYPFVISGVEPASMSGENIKGVYPCLSKRSVVSVGNAVLYASLHGMMSIGASGLSIMSDALFSSDDWAALNPETMISEVAYGRLHVLYTNDAGITSLLIFDGQALTTADVVATELYSDTAEGELYLGKTTGIYLWDAPTSSPMQGDWRSKDFVFPAPVNLGAAKIDYDAAISTSELAVLQAARTAAMVANAALVAAGNLQGQFNRSAYNARAYNGSAVVSVPSVDVADTVTFNLWNETTLICSRLVSDTNAFRLPAGLKRDCYSVEVITQSKIKEIRVAETMDGLKQA